MTDGQGGPVEDARFVVFTLGGYEYGLPADNVDEVIRFVAVTPVPESPDWVLGVIDLRGRAIPVVDGCGCARNSGGTHKKVDSR